MLDVSLFRQRSFLGARIAAFTTSGAVFSLFLYLATYLQTIVDFSALQAGLAFLPITGLVLLSGPASSSPGWAPASPTRRWPPWPSAWSTCGAAA